MSSSSLKSDVRQHGLAQRRTLTPEQRQAFTLRMWKHLQAWVPFQQIRTLHCSLPLPEEPDTTTWFERAWTLGKQTAVPCMTLGTLELKHTRLTSLEHLQRGAFGVPEPIPEFREWVQPESLDLVLVPGVAFDQNGGRLGFGKGYYDRFLSKTSALRMGVAFSVQVIPDVPTESHDVPMNALLTENGIILIESNRKYSKIH
ncbi:MAG: 5-formyltetrahydrofolate cyclo-ligase [Deltaproteobacteria bacterium]|jgi:5-formyltetrahydrofolate cyclo-ligase|nr:5-formyltetrahydrofolate cyclo-ligase [Deltaproteobacteria bacterium]MDP7158723.1 5-formyltetrahydrofolate cyclo-ligase [SAR324 cluster bacterium]MDP7317244.1 5-formyltetrahydrofolate cyclo-ligase [SAR324 cluster bacterium]